MTSRRDQIQAHRFAARRVQYAVVGGAASPAQPPDQRLRAGLRLGTAACVVGLGVTAVLGVFRPAPSAEWRTGRTVVVEQGTYNRYLYTGGALHPVRNLASAKLLLASSGTVEVPASALAGVPRGNPIGIPDAPDDLPAATNLDASRWTACSVPPAAGGMPSVSAALGGGAPGKRLEASQALLVSANGADYLLWQGERHEISAPVTTLASLGMAAADRPERVASSWLDVIPEGGRIGPMTVGARRAAPFVPGTPARVGDLETVRDASGEHRYVVTGHGLTPVTMVQAALLRGGGSPAPRPLGEQTLSAAVSAGLVTEPLSAASALPAALPVLAEPGSVAVCLSVTTGTGSPFVAGLTLASATAVDMAGVWLPTGAVVGSRQAERTLVAPGSGALVSADGADCLLTDTGVRYPIGSVQDLSRLGYGAVKPVRVPLALLVLFPAGPVLSARSAQTGTALR